MDNIHPTEQNISQTPVPNFQQIQQVYQNYNISTQNQNTDIYLFDSPLEKTTYLFKKGRQYSFLKAIITSVVSLMIGQSDNNIQAYIVIFQTPIRDDLNIFFLESDLQSPKIFFHKLEKVGLYVTINLPRTDKLELLRQFIYSKINTINTRFIPYRTGWYEKQYYYLTMAEATLLSESGITTPVSKRYFSVSNISFDNREKQIVNLFTNPDVLLLFVITAGALAYTPLKNAGFRPNALFMLDLNLQTTISSIKLMQHWAKKLHINLSEQKKFTKSLAEFKDEVVILMDNNTNYTLQMSENINFILQNGHLINDEIEELNAIPVLVTKRMKKWHDRCTKTLMLPSPSCNISDECIQMFWKDFCDMFSSEYDYFINAIDEKDDNNSLIREYSSEFQWLMKAYKLFYHYLERKAILTKDPMQRIENFDQYINDWLICIEWENYANSSEIFINWLKDMKNKNSIKFVKPCNYSFQENNGELIIAVDKTYCYIESTVMEKCVKESLVGKDVKEVYVALVEDEYAKGEKDSHVYPKVPEKAGFKKRVRMAQIKRELLLSDAEFTLEVI